MIVRIFAAASLLAGTAALAQAPASQTTATHTTVTKTTTPTIGAPATAVHKTTHVRTASVASNGHMVSTTTKTGKTITYDCSKAGNRTKAACKK